MERIPVAGPWITDREISYVTDAVTNCWYGQANKYHDLFERQFAKYVGVKHAVALPSCTSALHLSLAALGIGPGDEVIIPDVTWIASAAPVSYVNATPIFADIDPTTYCLSAKSFEEHITRRTQAVIVVDLYGSMPEWDEIRAIARRHDIHIIEDAAEAFGSRYHGKMAGCLGATGCFSFHGSKTMTTGEGGMLVTDSDDLYERVLFLRDHGRVPGDVSFYNNEIAFKYKMSSMQAALGLAQVERADELVGRKRQIFSWYHEQLSGMPGLQVNSEPEGTFNSYWMVTAVLDPSLGIDKKTLSSELAACGIDTRPFFHPLSSLPAYRGHLQASQARVRNTVSYQVSPFGINLPCGLTVTEEQTRRVSSALISVLESHTQSARKTA